MTVPRLRCALYTRKSSEEGLDQSFNSLDAQREACEAYVKSQASEGWRALPDPYDDGGFSGGSMDRPALKRLLADIAADKIDVIVVYKIDRLTRSLPDFARMVELFDQHNVSFVSVTQAFNTTTSMGRLTLNVLLSFAQFEREVTGERIRDKIAASKAKGMWMGGCPPLGYDLPTDSTRALVVNEPEAQTVRTIFATYLELASVNALERWLSERGILSKARITRSGKSTGGRPFSRGALFHLLRNRTYLGLIVHKSAVHPGVHPAIVDTDLFESVQALLTANAGRSKSRGKRVAAAVLTGRIFDADGQVMSPTFSHGSSGRVYRYYVSAPLQQGQRRAVGDGAIRRVAANAIEAKVAESLERLLAGHREPLSQLLRVEIHSASLELLLPAKGLATLRSRLGPGEHIQSEPRSSALRIVIPIRMQLRGGRTRIVGAGAPQAQPDRSLVKALRAAHALVATDRNGLPMLGAAPAAKYHRRLVRLAFLAPDLQAAILEGRQPPGLTLEQLMRKPLPALWSVQREVVAASCYRP